MARSMPLLAAAAAAGGRRRLVDLWATAPSAFNWQEPLGQAPIPPWSSWPRDLQNGVLFAACFLAFILVAGVILWLLRLAGDKDVEQDDTCRDVRGPWSNNDNDDDDDDDGEAVTVSAPFPWLQQEQQQLPSTSWNDDDGHPPGTDSGEGRSRPPRRRRRQQQPPPTMVPEVPVAAATLTAMGGVELTPAGVQWVLANFELPPLPVPPATTTDVETAAPVEDVDMEMAAVAEDVEMEMEEPEPEPEPPAPTLKCRFSTAEGWAEGTCSVCLSELVDGDMVRVLTACMHCFHATCVEKWLRENATCPLCRAPTIAVPARGRRRRRQQQNQIVMTAPADPDVSLAY